MRGSFYFLFLILLIGLYGIIQSLYFKYIESIFVPLLSSSIVFILMIIELLKIIPIRIGSRKEKNSDFIDEPLTLIELTKLLPLLGWIAGFFLIMYLFSSMVAVPIFVTFYLQKSGRGWPISITSALILTGLMYLTFDFLLHVHLTRGLIANEIIALIRR